MIAQQTKDLRSSHFTLGKETGVGQASSAVMYKAPPTQSLLSSGNNETKAAKLRIQRTNFSLKDGTKSPKGPTTQSEANN